MSRLHGHPENHLVNCIGWLRAAVLGAKDGIISTASLIVGVPYLGQATIASDDLRPDTTTGSSSTRPRGALRTPWPRQ